MMSRALLLNTPAVELSPGYHATVGRFLLLGVFPDIHLRVKFASVYITALIWGKKCFFLSFFFMNIKSEEQLFEASVYH